MTAATSARRASSSDWLPSGLPAARRSRISSWRTVPTRLGGLKVLAIEGPDAARFLYDEDHVRRAHALPEPVQSTLLGKGERLTPDAVERSEMT